VRGRASALAGTGVITRESSGAPRVSPRVLISVAEHRWRALQLP